jgi:hypothetical protein
MEIDGSQSGPQGALEGRLSRKKGPIFRSGQTQLAPERRLERARWGSGIAAFEPQLTRISRKTIINSHSYSDHSTKRGTPE